MQNKILISAELAQLVEATARKVAEEYVIASKEVLTSEETARYMGISLSCLYKMTMTRAIPYYKPNGKQVFFNREEVEAWLQHNRIATNEELEAEAQKYVSKKGGLK